jgi:hypothetical protein
VNRGRPPAHRMHMATWRVVRQDDNGNCYVVGSGLTEPEAETLARAYEARAHKQIYCVEEEQTPEPIRASSPPRSSS